MTARPLLLVNLARLDPGLAEGLAKLGWDVKAEPCVDQISTPGARGRPMVGLVIIDENCDPAQIESIPKLCPAEWLALAPAELLEDPRWATVIAQNFHDHHPLPADLHRLSVTLGHAHGRRMLLQNLNAGNDWVGRYGMIGQSPPMQDLYTRLDRITRIDAPVLITGESGTGKELVARALHKHSNRKSGPFVAANCGGLADNLILSELLGHEKGAFPGAAQRKVGSIEAASDGVLFLDEIGDLPVALQGTLLRVLQEKTIVRVGATQPIRINVRVVAATHVNLAGAVAAGKFREDLYDRLNVVRVEVPPLRQRGDDIELLANALFASLASQRSAHVRGISSAALAAMRQHSWPGNVREFINRLHQAMFLGTNRLLAASDLDLPDYVERAKVAALSRTRQRFEREVIRSVLEGNHQNVSKTARDLGVSRVTLYRLFEKFEIERG